MTADPWAGRLARVDEAVDRVMAETVRIVPTRTSDFAGAVADPDRAAFEVPGLLTVWRGEQDQGGDALKLQMSRVTTSDAELQIMKSKLPPGALIRKNDRVEALARGVAYTIARIDRQHPGRLALKLSVIGQ